MDRAQLFCVFC